MLFPDDSHAASCHGEGLRAEVSPHSSWKGKAGLDDEDGDGCSVVTSATAGGKFREIVQDLPLVDNEQSKGLSCKGCGCQASDKNAWTRYSPVYEGSEIVGKKPKGSVCKICTVTFQTSGLDAMHSSIGAFFKHGATAAGRAPLQDFLKKRKVLEKEGVDTLTKKARQLSREVGTTELSLQTLQGRKMLTKRQFVSVQFWDPKLDGQLDTSKIVKEVIKGKEVEGCWVLQGREGVWDEETYMDDRMLEDRLEVVDTGAFGQERLANNLDVGFIAIRNGHSSSDASIASIVVRIFLFKGSVG